MRFSYAKNYSDYYPTHPGGKGKGRSTEPEVIDLNKLQDWKSMLLPPSMDTKGFVMTGQNFVKVNMITRTWAGKRASVTLGWRLIKHRVLKKDYASLGRALIARMALTYKDLNGEIWLDSPFIDFIYENDQVTGLTVNKNGKQVTIKINKGLIFGSSGFSRDQEKRDKFLPSPQNVDWTSSPIGQTGDIIEPFANGSVWIDGQSLGCTYCH